MIRRHASWPSLEALEYVTLPWGDRLNNRRLLGSIGHFPPAEAEASFYATLDGNSMAA